MKTGGTWRVAGKQALNRLTDTRAAIFAMHATAVAMNKHSRTVDGHHAGTVTEISVCLGSPYRNERCCRLLSFVFLLSSDVTQASSPSPFQVQVAAPTFLALRFPRYRSAVAVASVHITVTARHATFRVISS